MPVRQYPSAKQDRSAGDASELCDDLVEQVEANVKRRAAGCAAEQICNSPRGAPRQKEAWLASGPDPPMVIRWLECQETLQFAARDGAPDVRSSAVACPQSPLFAGECPDRGAGGDSGVASMYASSKTG